MNFMTFDFVMFNIISTTHAEHIAKKLVNKDNVKVFFLGKNKDNKRYFPDGEIYARISEISKVKGRTIVLHSGSPNPNSGLVELRMVLDILNEAKVKPIEMFFTYFPYGMQDSVDQVGSSNVARNLIKEYIDYRSVSKISIIDTHFFGKDWLKDYTINNVSAVELLKQRAEQDYNDIVYLAPDTGSQLRTGLTGTKKKRKDSFTTEIHSNEEFEDLVKNRVVGVVDDVLETGGTLERFYDECIKCGAKDVVALITHGVLKEGVLKIKNKYSKLYLTNTVEQGDANVDVSGLVLQSIS